jgi:hypothetical protein
VQSPVLQTLTRLEFASTGTKFKIDSFVNSGRAQHAFHSAAHKTFDFVQHHHRQMLATAVTSGLYHVAGLDFPPDVHQAIHHEVEHLAENLSVAKGIAHHMMVHAVHKLRALHECECDDELYELLSKLHQVLQEIECQSH